MAGIVIVGLRVVLRTLLDGTSGGHVLFRLPQLPLPDAAAGIRVGGPVSLESVLAATYDGSLLLVTHAVAILGIVKGLTGTEEDIPCPVASLFRLDSAGLAWTPTRLADTSHLDDLGDGPVLGSRS